jgi:oligoribonuclease NrnB/cAMP/cGMP phosphodiesterase (DHH superfamily)
LAKADETFNSMSMEVFSNFANTHKQRVSVSIWNLIDHQAATRQQSELFKKLMEIEERNQMLREAERLIDTYRSAQLKIMNGEMMQEVREE